MKALNKQTAPKSVAPERIIQFGEGNFLRAFVDWIVYNMNQKTDFNSSVVVVQPIERGMAEWLNGQDCLYHVNLQGRLNGEAVNSLTRIDCISRALNPYSQNAAFMALADQPEIRFVISNTTEAGIAFDPNCKFSDAPASSYPGKLTQLLYRRFKTFKGDKSKGLIIMPCELIFLNGHHLKECIYQYIELWKEDFGADYEKFKTWFTKYCYVCATLVDRIVPGRIRDPKELAAMEEANGYHDAALDVGEVFGVWVIEGPAELEDKLPFKKAGVNVMVVPDVTPYKKRKVRILNGAHTGFVLGAYLAGFDIVRDCMHNDTIRGFMNKMLHEEIIPTLPLDKKDLEEFASAVEDRFNNPFVNHELMSISLNSTSKWKARNMPSFLAYIEEQKQLPKCLTMSLAAYIAFYSSDIQERTADGLICKRPAGNTYKIQDDAWALDFYYAHKDDTAAQLVNAVLTNTQMWDQDLTKIEGLEAAVLADLEMIRTQGAEAAYKSCL